MTSCPSNHLVIVIPGRLAGANEYILKCRTDRVGAARYKALQERRIKAAALDCLHHKPIPFDRPVIMHYRWVEPDMRRDKDNIAFGRKFVQDALVSLGLLRGDGWRYIAGFTDEFGVDRQHPRIEIEFEEVEYIDPKRSKRRVDRVEARGAQD